MRSKTLIGQFNWNSHYSLHNLFLLHSSTCHTCILRIPPYWVLLTTRKTDVGAMCASICNRCNRLTAMLGFLFWLLNEFAQIKAIMCFLSRLVTDSSDLLQIRKWNFRKRTSLSPGSDLKRYPTNMTGYAELLPPPRHLSAHSPTGG